MLKFQTLRNALTYIPKKVFILMGIAAAVAVPFAVSAWGPERELFTIEKPASYVTFNSITNNPDIGDERNFVAARVDNGASAGLNNVWNANEITAKDGESYFVRLYVHNNAAANLNLVAQNVRAKAAIPTGTAKVQTINGFVSADNSRPLEIWDYVTFNSDKDFYLAVDSDYGVHYANNGIGKGTDAKLDYNNFFNSNGALLGYDKLDGKIPGCFQYDGYVSFKVRPIFAKADFEMSKQVSKHDAKTWGETYAAQPGELVDFRIDYTNVTGEKQDNVTLRDQLPEGLTIEDVRFWNTFTGAWQTPTDINDIAGIGINIGNISGKNTKTRAELVVKMPSEDVLECGVNTFRNIGRVSINGGGQKEDDATVTVEKECDEPEVVYTCDALTVNKIGRTKFDFSTRYSVKNATYKSITYVIRDKDGKEIKREVVTGADTKYSYEQTVAGDYTVEAIVAVTVNGEDKTVTSAACKKDFTVDTEDVKPEYVCKVMKADRAKISVGDKVKFVITPEFKGNVSIKEYSIDFGDTQTARQTGNAFEHTYNKEGTFKAKGFVTFEVEGKTVADITSVECEETITVTTTPPEYCEVPGKEYLPKGHPDCKEGGKTPPSDIPSTGAGGVGAAIAIGSIVTAASYYIASRRKLDA